MKMFRTIAAAAAVALVAALTACSTAATPSASTSGGAENSSAPAEKLTVGFVAFHFDSYFTSVQKGVEKALGTDGELIPVSFDDDAGKEAQAYQDLISRQVDVILTSPFNPEGSVAGLKAAVAAGIPVVCYNTCVDPKYYDGLISGFVQSDNSSLGSITGDFAAKFIKDKLDNKATIGILNCDDFDVCKLRKQGFKDALTKAGVTFTVAADQKAYVADKTAAAAEAMLTANPSINILWAATDGGGTGAISAVKGGNLNGKVTVFSTDMSLALGEALKSGDNVLLATTGQDGVSQGAALVDIAKSVKAGEKAATFEKLIPGVLYSVDDLPTVEAWMADNK